MDITITLSGVQENSKYILEFSLGKDGIVTHTTKDQNNNKPSLDDIENDKPKLSAPSLEDTGVEKKSYKDFKTTTNINTKSL